MTANATLNGEHEVVVDQLYIALCYKCGNKFCYSGDEIIDVICPQCGTHNYVYRNTTVSNVRRLILYGAREYKYRGVRYKAFVPVPVYDDFVAQHLLNTGLFMADPPLDVKYVRYVGPERHRVVRLGVDNKSTVILRAGKLIRGESNFIEAISRKLSNGGLVHYLSNNEVIESISKNKSFSALFVRDMGLGDVLIFRSCLKDFKRQYPNSVITALTLARYMFVLEDVADQVGDIKSADWNALNYDVSANLCRKSEIAELNSTMHRADVYAMFMGFKLQDYDMSWNLSDPVKESAYNLLAEYNIDPDNDFVVTFQPYASTVIRSLNLPEVIDLAIKLRDRFNAKIIFTHHTRCNEFSRNGFINLSGLTNVEEYCGLIYWSKLVISGDSGAYHVKEAVGNGKACAVFSTIDPQYRTKYYKNVLSLWMQEETEMPCGGPCFDQGCRALHCLKYWTANRIFERIEPLIGELNPKGG